MKTKILLCLTILLGGSLNALASLGGIGNDLLTIISTDSNSCKNVRAHVIK